MNATSLSRKPARAAHRWKLALRQSPGTASRFSAVLHQLRHIIDRKMKVELEARRSRLGDLDQRLAPAKDIADINVLLGKPGGGEVFAERRRAEPLGLLGKSRIQSA